MNDQNFHFGDHVLLLLKIKDMTLEDLSDKITSLSYYELEVLLKKPVIPNPLLLEEFLKAFGFKKREELLDKKLKAA